MNKLLVLVYVPLLDEEFDIWIPVNQKIGKIKLSMIDTINSLMDNDTYLSSKLNLYDKNTSINYENDIYVKDSGIKNGARLMLI